MKTPPHRLQRNDKMLDEVHLLKELELLNPDEEEIWLSVEERNYLTNLIKKDIDNA